LIQFLQKPAFDRKIICVPQFLNREVFLHLRRAAKRQVEATRVNIPTHKRGKTISYHELHESAPEITAFYLSSALHNWCSGVIGSRVRPTPWNDLSSCSLLIYDQPRDHIAWHYDINFYKGRHFTALLSLINEDASGTNLSSAELRTLEDGRETAVCTGPNTFVLFEGAYVKHSVTPLGEGERRIILSMTFCTNPSATPFQDLMRRGKDIAYFGLRALWS
jgi:hypothetical protein